MAHRLSRARWLIAAIGGAWLASAPYPDGLLQAQDHHDAAVSPARQPLILGAASNFSQGSAPGILDAAQALPVRHFRDGVRWQLIENSPGNYRFNLARANYPAAIARHGGDLVLTVNWGNRLYDGGATPHTPEGVAAMGRFVAAMVERYPNISAVEVGNEFNGANFVKGPVKRAGLAERGRYHLAMVRAISEAARGVRPEIRILGGSTHSLAAGYLWPILEQAEAGLIDGLALHPYTTPIDQLAAQIGVLRRHPAARDMPIEITEWGTKDHAGAPDHLLRGYAAMAPLGVTSLYWYPLHPRGDGYAPLIAADGSPTPVGEAFRYAQARLGGRTAQDISPDPFTKVYLFADDTMVLWGEPRRLVLGDGLVARNARGERIDGDPMLSPDRAVVIEAEHAIHLGSDVVLGCSPLIADSFYQFAFPDDTRAEAAPGDSARFVPYALLQGQRLNWLTQPGQERAGVPWTPYLSLGSAREMRLTAERMRIAAGNGRPQQGEARVGHAFRAERSGTLRLQARFDLPARSSDRLVVNLRRDDAEVALAPGAAAGEIDQLVTVEAGQSLQIEAGTPGGGGARNISYRLRLLDPDRCRTVN